ncbi:16S rRNA (guanine(966)-N(2))-methyltransferase RsmD [Nitrococcus mobilis]|uniref:Ribosomal RNA small subunit methyltransferase D n=1 Tax=Nitrococcus mobilis Nb-231 TaxID=314278 RepID=A4BP13_9GAMM|nr:16S rRNA (guanine(966)-N(2))-methyltransferase RsmD [Nitrococcus mobilis]EAR22314.1 methyltransferase, putative [Nitrococcus mobilis Nb-231]
MPGQNQLRIIGGRWRRRWLRFTAIAELRPTPDAVRETLFNWLQFSVEGTRCLDLFAGSGALGLEAVSRGARQAVLVERSQVVVRSLLANVDRLQAGSVVRVIHAEAQRFLAGKPEPFDLVFLDPPFKSMLAERVCRQLDSGGWLTDGALIYLETDSHCSLGELPSNWRPLRAGVAGAVCYRLLRYEAAALAGDD